MAVAAAIISFDGLVFADLRPGSAIPRIASMPDERTWPFDFYWDLEGFHRGERCFVGLEVADVSLITDDWLAEFDKLALPRVDVAEAGLVDVTISDVLRWARRTYPSRFARAST